MARQTLTEIVVAEIRAELARQQKTLAQLAVILDLNPATVSQRMAGRIPFNVEELEKAAQWLGVPVWQFINPVVSSRAA